MIALEYQIVSLIISCSLTDTAVANLMEKVISRARIPAILEGLVTRGYVMRVEDETSLRYRATSKGKLKVIQFERQQNKDQ